MWLKQSGVGGAEDTVGGATEWHALLWTWVNTNAKNNNIISINEHVEHKTLLSDLINNSIISNHFDQNDLKWNKINYNKWTYRT